MINHYYLAFDVGGLLIKGGAINQKGELATDVLSYYPSKSRADRDEILDHFVNVIGSQITSIMDRQFVIDGIAFAFPGPFDYEKGICLIKGINKFDSLYGVNLKSELKKRLKRQKLFVNWASPDLEIFFENNVSLFALGEWNLRKHKGFKKIMCMTIGSGTGSAFLENGEIIKFRDDVPPNGWIYCLPFRDSIVDDYISVRGIQKIAEKSGFDPNITVDQLAKAARNGNKKSKQVFDRFGHLLTEMLLPLIRSFHPDVVVVGGYVSNYFDLFEEPVRTTLTKENVLIELSRDTSISVLSGISELISHRMPR